MREAAIRMMQNVDGAESMLMFVAFYGALDINKQLIDIPGTFLVI